MKSRFTFLGVYHVKFSRTIEPPCYPSLYIEGRIMAHRLPKLLFLGPLLFLNIVVASVAHIGRDEPGSDSFWGLDLDDVLGAGAAGLEALYQLWDFSTAPGVTSTPSGIPSEQSDERRYQPLETPDPEPFPPFEPAAMKKCAVGQESQGGQLDGSDVEENWWQVEQEPDTGRPIISACDLPPKNNNKDAYIVREIRFPEGRLKQRWPAAILVSDLADITHFRYNVIILAKSTTYTYQKIPNAIFMRQGMLTKLGYVRRRGWLVGAGQPKEVALKWFEDEVLGPTKWIDESVSTVTKLHFSATWVAKVFAKADQSGSPYWIPNR